MMMVDSVIQFFQLDVLVDHSRGKISLLIYFLFQGQGRSHNNRLWEAGFRRPGCVIGDPVPCDPLHPGDETWWATEPTWANPWHGQQPMWCCPQKSLVSLFLFSKFELVLHKIIWVAIHCYCPSDNNNNKSIIRDFVQRSSEKSVLY